MELFNGTMVKFFKVNGEMEQKMGMELGNRRREIFTKANGR